MPALQLEKLVVEAIRAKAKPDPEPEGELSDRAVIDRHVTGIIVRPDSIDIELREPTPATEPSPATEGSVAADVQIIHLHRRHQPALDRASVPFRQGSPASA